MNPPPLPPAAPPELPALNYDAPVTGIAGAEGMSHRELLEEIGQGGRFVIFLYAISVLVMTFKRGTSIRFVRAEQGVGGRAWGPTLLTLVAGWWGFPWGPIYSIQALFVNARGGKDVTQEILASLFGEEAAKSALRLRPAPKTGASLWALRATLLAIPTSIFLFGAFMASLADKQAEELKSRPGYEQWSVAANQLDGAAGGNTKQAQVAANVLKPLFESMFQLENRKGTKKTPKPFGVWCEFREHDAIVLIRWDSLWKLSSADRAMFDKSIWQAACATSSGLPEHEVGSSLIVGLKEGTTWEAALVGRLPAAEQAEDSKPDQSLTGNPARQRLVSAFAPAQ